MRGVDIERDIRRGERSGPEPPQQQKREYCESRHIEQNWTPLGRPNRMRRLKEFRIDRQPVDTANTRFCIGPAMSVNEWMMHHNPSPVANRRTGDPEFRNAELPEKSGSIEHDVDRVAVRSAPSTAMFFPFRRKARERGGRDGGTLPDIEYGSRSFRTADGRT